MPFAVLMRLDLFLKVSRLCLRRSIAQELCEAGLVSVNSRPAKSSHSVKVDDEVTLVMRNRRLTVRISKLPTSRSVSKTDAASLYEIISDEDVSSDQ